MTDVPLRDYIDERFEQLEGLVKVGLAHQQDVVIVRFDAMQKAVELSERRMEAKLEGMNEWRGAMNDRSAEFAKQDQVTRIQQWVDTAGGRWQALTVLATLLSIAAMVVTLWKVSGLGGVP